MASGDTLFIFEPKDNVPPNSAYATLDVIAAVTGLREVLDFAGSSPDEVAIFESVWPSHYGGGGIDVKIHYSMDGTSTGAVEWEVSVEVTKDNADQDATSGQNFGLVTDIADTPPGTVDQLLVTAVGAVTHANCGSPAAGDSMRLKIARDHDHATNTDDAQLQKVVVTET